MVVVVVGREGPWCKTHGRRTGPVCLLKRRHYRGGTDVPNPNGTVFITRHQSICVLRGKTEALHPAGRRSTFVPQVGRQTPGQHIEQANGAVVVPRRNILVGVFGKLHAFNTRFVRTKGTNDFPSF